MNISQVKTKLGVSILSFTQGKNEDGTPSPWVSSWDNESRVRIAMPNEVLDKLKADKDRSDLQLLYKDMVSTSSGEAYKLHIITTGEDIVAEF